MEEDRKKERKKVINSRLTVAPSQLTHRAKNQRDLGRSAQVLSKEQQRVHQKLMQGTKG